MAILRAFKALRPDPQTAQSVSAVPYDVVNTSEARQQVAGNPLSFLHVSRPEIDLPDGTDPYSDTVYAKAKENFGRLRREAPMFVEEVASLYLYKLQMGAHLQTGIAACCSVADYDLDLIRKHERTRQDKEDDRTRHILALRAQTGPVFLTYRQTDEIRETVRGSEGAEPLYVFAAPDGVQHTIWRLSEGTADRLIKAFDYVPFLYIADGHHRAASASRAAASLRADAPENDPAAEYNYFLAVLFPSDQVQILAYNRVVRDLNGLSEQQFLHAVAERFTLSPDAIAAPSKKGDLSMYLGGRWYGLNAKRSGPIPTSATADSGLISSLDVTILQDLLLDPILGIKDLRTDKRIDFVGGMRGTAALESLVDSGKAAVAFSMFPVTVDDLMAVADAELIMPPKSTWFEPKLRDGLLTHLI
jgi:uncharacterized protein (DUF1015 family)